MRGIIIVGKFNMTTLPLTLPDELAQRVQAVGLLESQELLNAIIKMTDQLDRKKSKPSLAGSLAEYANPNLIAHEKQAWAMAVAEKYENS